MARALGYRITPVGDEIVAGTRDIKLSNHGKEIFRTRSDTMTVPQMHNLAVLSRSHRDKRKKDVRVLGLAGEDAIEGFSIPGKLLTLQGHPEYDPRTLRDVIISASENDILNSKAAEDAIDDTCRAEGCGKWDDTRLMWQAIVRFLMESTEYQIVISGDMKD